jgi:hypothetical protein
MRFLIAAALVILSASAQARVIGVFPGDGRILPVILTDEPCIPGKSDGGQTGYRSIWVSPHANQKAESCWSYSTLGGPNKIISTCMTKDGERNGLVGGNCRWIAKSSFLDPASLPRAANFE